MVSDQPRQHVFLEDTPSLSTDLIACASVSMPCKPLTDADKRVIYTMFRMVDMKASPSDRRAVRNKENIYISYNSPLPNGDVKDVQMYFVDAPDMSLVVGQSMLGWTQ